MNWTTACDMEVVISTPETLKRTSSAYQPSNALRKTPTESKSKRIHTLPDHWPL